MRGRSNDPSHHEQTFDHSHVPLPRLSVILNTGVTQRLSSSVNDVYEWSLLFLFKIKMNGVILNSQQQFERLKNNDDANNDIG